MTTHETSVICLSVESLRADWADNPNFSDATLAILALGTDYELFVALDPCVGDFFWQAFDSVRSDATQLLFGKLGILEEDD